MAPKKRDRETSSSSPPSKHAKHARSQFLSAVEQMKKSVLSVPKGCRLLQTINKKSELPGHLQKRADIKAATDVLGVLFEAVTTDTVETAWSELEALAKAPNAQLESKRAEVEALEAASARVQERFHNRGGRESRRYTYGPKFGPRANWVAWDTKAQQVVASRQSLARGSGKCRKGAVENGAFVWSK